MSAVRCSRSTHWPGMAVPVATTVEDPHSVKSALRRSGGHGDPNCVNHEPLVGSPVATSFAPSAPRRAGARSAVSPARRRSRPQRPPCTQLELRQLLLCTIFLEFNSYTRTCHWFSPPPLCLPFGMCDSETVGQSRIGRSSDGAHRRRSGWRTRDAPARPALSGHAARASR